MTNKKELLSQYNEVIKKAIEGTILRYKNNNRVLAELITANLKENKDNTSIIEKRKQNNSSIEKYSSIQKKIEKEFNLEESEYKYIGLSLLENSRAQVDYAKSATEAAEKLSTLSKAFFTTGNAE